MAQGGALLQARARPRKQGANVTPLPRPYLQAQRPALAIDLTDDVIDPRTHAQMVGASVSGGAVSGGRRGHRHHGGMNLQARLIHRISVQNKKAGKKMHIAQMSRMAKAIRLRMRR